MTTGIGAHEPDLCVATFSLSCKSKPNKIDTDPDSESQSINVGFSSTRLSASVDDIESCNTVGDIERERDREVQDIPGPWPRAWF